MKNFILLACLSILPFGLLADDLKKEKKNLIETIKDNYDSWQVKQSAGLIDFPDSTKSEQLDASASQIKYRTDVKDGAHIFSDFNFKICESQAVVQFQVDFQMISAFMEKKDGQWQLVCAALIPLDL